MDSKEKDNLTDVAEIAQDSHDVEVETPEGRVEGDNGDIVTLNN